MNERPIAAWLRTTRLRQLDEKGDPWTQDRLLSLMQSEIGWAPHRPNYSKYEQGKATPERETLAKFVTFWAAHGEPGPDLTTREVDDTDPMVAAIDRQTAMLERVLTALTERAIDPAAVTALQEWAIAQASTRLQRRGSGLEGEPPLSAQSR
jgi:hypothetical protein